MQISGRRSTFLIHAGPLRSVFSHGGSRCRRPQALRRLGRTGLRAVQGVDGGVGVDVGGVEAQQTAGTAGTVGLPCMGLLRLDADIRTRQRHLALGIVHP